MKKQIPLGELLTQVKRPVKLIDDQLYTNLGVKWYALGLFLKEPQLGSQIKATTLYQVKAGDFVYNRLFAWKGSFAIAQPEHNGMSVSSEFPTFEINKKLNPSYLKYFFSLPEIWEGISAKSSGTSQTSRLRLKEKDFLEMKIPFRPLPEQEYIVHLLDEAESLRVARTRANARMDQFVPALFNETFGNSEVNPKNFPLCKLSEIAYINPRPLRTDFPSMETPVTFVPMAAVNSETYTIDKSELRQLGEVVKGFTPFQNNDVLFAKITPCMENGKIVIAENLTNGIGYGSTEFHVLRARNENITSEWLLWLVRRESFRQEAAKAFTGTAGQQRVPTKFLENYKTPLPPLALQREFAARVEEARGVQSAQGKSAGRVEALYQSMLSRAFAGEL